MVDLIDSNGIFQRIIAVGYVKSAVKIGEDFSYRTHFLQNSLKQTEGLSLQGLLIALAFGERAWLDNKNTADLPTNEYGTFDCHFRAPYWFSNGNRLFLCSIIAIRTAYTLYFILVSTLLWCVDCFRLCLFSRI